MAGLQTGYNPKQIEEVMNEIKNTYDQLGTKIYDGWQSVWPVMQREWVGADEQSLEEAFVKKMCQLYTSAAGVVNALLNNLYSAGEAWNQFQQSNTMSSANQHNSTYGIENMQVTVNDAIIVFQEMNITDDMDRGLLQGTASANTIKQAMDTYMADIKQGVNELYSGIDASNAFMGDSQTQSIKQYIETIGEGVATVATAANDIYEALDTQITSNYTQAEEQVSSEYNSSKAQSEIDSAVDASMRWHA